MKRDKIIKIGIVLCFVTILAPVVIADETELLNLEEYRVFGIGTCRRMKIEGVAYHLELVFGIISNLTLNIDNREAIISSPADYTIILKNKDRILREDELPEDLDINNFSGFIFIYNFHQSWGSSFCRFFIIGKGCYAATK